MKCNNLKKVLSQEMTTLNWNIYSLGKKGGIRFLLIVQNTNGIKYERDKNHAVVEARDIRYEKYLVE